MIRILLLSGALLQVGQPPAEGVQAPVAQSPADMEAQRLFREVMSPFCPGLTLADCPSPNAFTMRDELEARLAKGEPREAILEELVAKYGATILADPSETPIGSVVWGVPIVLSALAAGGLALLVRRATRGAEREPGATAVSPPDLRERLDAELDALD